MIYEKIDKKIYVYFGLKASESVKGLINYYYYFSFRFRFCFEAIKLEFFQLTIGDSGYMVSYSNLNFF